MTKDTDQVIALAIMSAVSHNVDIPPGPLSLPTTPSTVKLTQLSVRVTDNSTSEYKKIL